MSMSDDTTAHVEGDPAKDLGDGTPKATWPLYEVFVRGKRGLNHVHVGSLHAPTTTWPCTTPATSTPGATRA